MFNVGDLVIINNDSNQFIYKIKEISNKVCLVGNSYRVIKYVDISDIRHASVDEINKEKKDIQKETYLKVLWLQDLLLALLDSYILDLYI